MTDILACEALATKEELQQLRDEIIALLGRPATGTGQPIDVLTQGNLDNTSIATKLIKNIQVIEPTEADPELKVAFVSGDESEGVDVKDLATTGFRFLGQGISNSVKLTTTLIVLAKERKLREQVTQQYIDELTKFIDSNSVAKGLETAIRKDYDFARANDFWGLLDNVDGNTSQAKQNTEIYKQNIENAKQNIETLKQGIQEQNQTIDDLIRKDYFQDRTIDVLRQDLATLSRENRENYLLSQETRQQLEIELFETRNLIDQAEDEREKLRETIIKFQDRLTSSETELTEVIDLYNDLATEQTNMKSRIEELERQLAEPDITDDEPVTPITVIRKTWQQSSGGGLTPGIRTTIYNNQNATLEIARNLAGNPDTVTTPEGETITANPTITMTDIINDDSPFEDTFRALVPNFFNPNDFTPTGEPQVTPQQLRDEFANFRQQVRDDNRDITTAIVSTTIAPPLNDILNQTRPDAFKDAATEAICDSTNNPNGCMNRGIKQPLQNGLNTLGNNLDTGFGLLNALLNNQIGQGSSSVTEAERREAITGIVNGDTFAAYRVGFQSENL